MTISYNPKSRALSFMSYAPNARAALTKYHEYWD
jgi:hypothetical protein